MSSIVLILGAGKNVGSSVASLFFQKGFRVALAARKFQDTTTENGELHVQADLSDSNAVERVFDKVEEALGPANVVVYNGIASR